MTVSPPPIRLSTRRIGFYSLRDGRSPLLAVLDGKVLDRPPVWLMRQAGRYLPEYRAVRAEAGGFLDLCFSPDLAAEVTLQPIRRFALDAAILFSDILVVPHALGQSVRFLEGEGPVLDAIPDRAALSRLAGRLDLEKLDPVYRTVGLVKASLPAEVALLGFCGAPWTVATYMVGGSGSPDQAAARLFAYRDPEGFGALIRLLVEASVDHLVAQLEAGADAVQIFDSWAGVLPPEEFARWCTAPIAAIVAGVRARKPGARIIAFPRAAGTKLGDFVKAVPANGIGLDTAEDRRAAIGIVSPSIALQGNIDPLALVIGGAALDRAVDAVLGDFSGRAAIVNLGHGVRQETPPEHVERLVRRVRGER
jgi:uroporphyrinogen decarboxylase